MDSVPVSVNLIIAKPAARSCPSSAYYWLIVRRSFTEASFRAVRPSRRPVINGAGACSAPFFRLVGGVPADPLDVPPTMFSSFEFTKDG